MASPEIVISYAHLIVYRKINACDGVQSATHRIQFSGRSLTAACDLTDFALANPVNKVGLVFCFHNRMYVSTAGNRIYLRVSNREAGFAGKAGLSRIEDGLLCYYLKPATNLKHEIKQLVHQTLRKRLTGNL